MHIVYTKPCERPSFFTPLSCTPLCLCSYLCSEFLDQISSGNAVSGNMAGAHGVTGRSVPRPMLGMQRMQPQGMTGYNLTSQAGMGGGMNPGGIPMQRGVNPQAHQQQHVFLLVLFICGIVFFFFCLFFFLTNACHNLS